MPEIYSAIAQAGTSIVFVNTRAQAELVFQLLWDHNTQNLPIAVYHGSLSKEQRRRTEAMMAAGKLRCVVATSALELGIDWGDVDLVIQLGAPKGVSRLLQRIGRSNHRFNEPSKALLVPSNRFEAMECRAAIEAIDKGKLDGDALLPGSYDVVVQFIINCACSAPVNADRLYREIITAPPYASLPRAVFDQLFEFAIDGGYVLRRYERYQRLIQNDEGDYIPASRLISQRHRQNIGTIVEATHLRVKRMNPKRGGKILGTIEEHFAQQLTPGDTFFFGGETLAFIRVHDMTLEARPAPAKEPKIPSYVGGQMPLSTFLANGVRHMFNREESWHQLPHEVQEWLSLQKQFSTIPPVDGLLVESFPRHKLHQCLFYTFEGRKANQTLGMLITRRMERLALKPLSFLVTDYGLAVTSVQAVDAEHISALLSPDLLGGELEEWIAESPMLKRSFRRIATVAGLIEQRYAGSHKTVKQVTFSTDLIYDVLRKHEPNHILLHLCRQDAERELLDIKRLSDMLNRFEDKVLFHSLTRPSPLSVPVISDVRNEAVPGSGIEALLELGTAQEQADQMMEDVRNAVA
ncbi:MAG: DNA ligase-associated DEXH box helicase [Rickettsiales bacterium]|nr:DNA ligase-associated DEXH box helicase [Rickettsiales bacterium]